MRQLSFRCQLFLLICASIGYCVEHTEQPAKTSGAKTLAPPSRSPQPSASPPPQSTVPPTQPAAPQAAVQEHTPTADNASRTSQPTQNPPPVAAQSPSTRPTPRTASRPRPTTGGLSLPGYSGGSASRKRRAPSPDSSTSDESTPEPATKRPRTDNANSPIAPRTRNPVQRNVAPKSLAPAPVKDYNLPKDFIAEQKAVTTGLGRGDMQHWYKEMQEHNGWNDAQTQAFKRQMARYKTDQSAAEAREAAGGVLSDGEKARRREKYEETRKARQGMSKEEVEKDKARIKLERKQAARQDPTKKAEENRRNRERAAENPYADKSREEKDEHNRTVRERRANWSEEQRAVEAQKRATRYQEADQEELNRKARERWATIPTDDPRKEKVRAAARARDANIPDSVKDDEYLQKMEGKVRAREITDEEAVKLSLARSRQITTHDETKAEPSRAGKDAILEERKEDSRVRYRQHRPDVDQALADPRGLRATLPRRSQQLPAGLPGGFPGPQQVAPMAPMQVAPTVPVQVHPSTEAGESASAPEGSAQGAGGDSLSAQERRRRSSTSSGLFVSPGPDEAQ